MLAAKSRLAKKGLTIPPTRACPRSHGRQLIITNASNALSHLPHEKHASLDSTVALWWIKGEGDYMQFVSNRVAKI